MFSWSRETQEWGLPTAVEATARDVGAWFDAHVSDDVRNDVGSHWAGYVRYGRRKPTSSDVKAWAYDALVSEPSVPASALRDFESAFLGSSLMDTPPHGRTAHREGWTVRALGRLLASILVAAGNPDGVRRELATAVVRAAAQRDADDMAPSQHAPLTGYLQQMSLVLDSGRAPWSAEFAARMAGRMNASDPTSVPDLWEGFATRTGKNLSLGVPLALLALTALWVWKK